MVQLSAGITAQRPDELARELGLRDPTDPAPTWAGVANLVRVASWRWGACRRLDLKRHTQELCLAAGFSVDVVDQRVEQVLDLLVDLRELEEASVAASPPEAREEEPEGMDEDELSAAQPPRPPAAGRYLVPALPRLVLCGEIGFLVGPVEPPGARPGFALLEDGPGSVVRWSSQAELPLDVRAERGIGLWTLSDWLGAPEHQRWQRRWAARLAPDLEVHVAGGLSELWRLLDRGLTELGMPVSDDAGFRVLAGRPGGRFGRPDAPGRWVGAGQAPDGRWCAAQRGYRDNHWRPGIAELQAGKLRRWLDLYDWDELWWAHLSRAARVGPREIYTSSGDEIRLATALPRQLRRLGALGARQGWRWSSPAHASLAAALEDAGLQARPD